MPSGSAKGFADVLADELDAVRRLRDRRAVRRPGAADDADDAGGSASPDQETSPLAAARDMRLLGLSLSGGGIRSATFNLGVLQALARAGILPLVDYLSTVSGGGYIGSWLTGWCHRLGIADPDDGFARLAKALDPTPVGGRGAGDGDPWSEQPEIRFLREYSNYLTPRLGAFSGDSWTIATTYARNLLLNLLILTSALGAVLLVPIALARGHRWLMGGGWPAEPAGLFVFAFISLALAVAFVALNLSDVRSTTTGRGTALSRRVSQMGVVWITLWVVGPIFVSAGAVSLWLGRIDLEAEGSWPIYVGSALCYMLIWAYGWLVSRGMAGNRYTLRQVLSILVWAPVAGAVGGGFLRTVDLALETLGGAHPWHAVTFGTPLIVLVFMTTAVLHIGLVGNRGFQDEQLEWWSRLGATLSIWVAGILLLFAFSIYGPYLLAIQDWSGVRGWAKTAAASGWLATTVGGLLAGRRAGARKEGAAVASRASPVAAGLATLAPWVFVVGLLLAVASGLHAVLLAAAPPGTPHLEALDTSSPVLLAGLLSGLTIVAVVLAWRVGINEFSMHALYRNRLVRCYLGASNRDYGPPTRDRAPHPFTGFDRSDGNVPLALLDPAAGHVGPYHLVNATLNLVHGRRLAWQQRRATSFVFSPKYCGYDYGPNPSAPSWVTHEGDGLQPSGYRPSTHYGSGNDPGFPGRHGRPALRLGTAMAISGAAMSPSMGHFTSAPLAFLMTVFNLRLGWWLGNPRHDATWWRQGPEFSLKPLTQELLGFTNDENTWVYLSDGGHFENLGVYELVKRRCRYVIACDAGQDRDVEFADLGNAIEKCRTDLGVPIEIDVEQIRRRDDSGHSQWHCAVGKIRYDKVDARSPAGILVYLKASLTGDEETDVLKYAVRNPPFPHQTTTDQWFTESQFESYRVLGHHIAREVFSDVEEEARAGDTGTLFLKLRQRWHPPSAAHHETHVGLAAARDRLLEIIRTDPDVRFLDVQGYPDLVEVARTGVGSGRIVGPATVDRWEEWWQPRTYRELRSGFYLAKQMIQLMENAFHDLDLDARWSHPDNRGWCNLFRRWAGSRTVQFTWGLTASTFGSRFQDFCQRRFGLQPGGVDAELVHRFADVDQLRTAVVEAAETRRRRALPRPFVPSADDDAPRGGTALGLDLTELDQLGSYVTRWGSTWSGGDGAATPVAFVSLRLSIRDPLARDASFDVPCGCAVVRDADDALLYFAVRDFLRRTGFGRAGLEVLVRDRDVRTIVTPDELREEESVQQLLAMFHALVVEHGPPG